MFCKKNKTQFGFTRTIGLSKKSQVCGFTILELLVVIAIIGILAAIVMTSVSDSREKAKIAKIKTYADEFIKEAFILGDGASTTGGYFYGQCPTTTGSAGGTILTNQSLLDKINFARAEGVDKAYCVFNNNSTGNWVVGIDLPSGTQFWCIDNTGVKKLFNGGAASTYSAGLDPATSRCK